MTIDQLIANESFRRSHFPVCAERIFMAHAAVCPMPKAAADALNAFTLAGTRDHQENREVMARVQATRDTAAALLGAHRDEIALLGPTALGLNLVALGLAWQPGDEVVFYQDDYPANVYPWMAIEQRGVKAVRVQPEHPGAITWDVVEAALTDRTRLVSLATCNYLSGYRIDVDRIGRELHARGILFCVDAIQTLGAFPLSVEHVDFLSADSHKWMLGCCGAGIFYVKHAMLDQLQPPIVGALNVRGWETFVAQESPEFLQTARRFEFGTLNIPGILAMGASLQMLHDTGIDAIAARILHLRKTLLDALRPLGFQLYIESIDKDPRTDDATRSGIVTLTHANRSIPDLAKHLAANNVTASLRQNRAGQHLLRLSPHFYNTEDEIARVAKLME